MNHHVTRISASFILLGSLAISGCTATFQIGGRQNSSEQNRQAPVSNRSEVAVATPQPTAEPVQSQPSSPEATQEESDQVEPQQTTTDAERNELEDMRLANERRELEQQRLEQEARLAHAQANLREQQAILEEKTQAANQRLANLQQQQLAPSRPIISNNEIEQSSAVNQIPTQTIYARTQTSNGPRILYSLESDIDSNKDKKKGHSTRNKVILGSAIGGAAILGIVLSKRH